MKSVRKRIGTGLVLSGLVALGIGMVARPSYGAVPNTSDCLSHLSDSQLGALSVTASPASPVPAGETVRVDATWHTAEWDETDRILVCTTTDGIWDSRMAGGQRPMTNDGIFSWYFTVPADMPVGTEICVKDVLEGQSTNRDPQHQVSNTVCFRTAAALPATTATTAAPTTTTTVATTSEPDVIPSGNGNGGDVILSQPATQPAAPEAELPRTGSSTGALALAGALAMLVGGTLVALGRRRPAGSNA
jgi:LPXTG-motif cell wall-anchored protein